MGESRTELIAWLNDLLQVNYTKVEQCGTGGAYCQIMDSVFGQSFHALLRRDRGLVTEADRCLDGQATYQWHA